MAVFTIENLSFTYPGEEKPALQDISLTIREGEFVVLCGMSGGGKSTFMRQLKTALAPHGKKEGRILFEGTPLEELDHRTQSAKIGFVLQSPDNQIVTDKVWHELAFGLESLGLETPVIRSRVAEMAGFFGISGWFHKNVTELSGGQKQLLNLASVMAMQPSVLLLDEPTSQLDPIAAEEFVSILAKINRELGTTIIVSEHRLEEVLTAAHRLIVIDKGKIAADGTPGETGKKLKEMDHQLFLSMPAPMQIYGEVKSSRPCPLTVREGREWLEAEVRDRELDPQKITMEETPGGRKTALTTEKEVSIRMDQVWFRYEKEGEDILKGLSLSVHKGEFYAILGANGVGKTTALNLISGLFTPYRGKVLLEGKDLQKISGPELFQNFLGVLPQNPQALFLKKTLREDLMEMLSGTALSKDEKRARAWEVAELCCIEDLLDRHPYDLSGGEQQRAALAKVLLLEPRILLLDEPTKGMDGEFKQIFASILFKLLDQGKTILMISHDIEFCAKYAGRCGLFFDGILVSEGESRKFFSGNSFYTTATNRMSRSLFPEAIIPEDVIGVLGGTSPQPDPPAAPPQGGEPCEGGPSGHESFPPHPSPAEIPSPQGECTMRNVTYAETISVQGKLSPRTKAAMAMIFLAVPLTIFIGIWFLDDRKYYFISLLILLECMLPFVLVFENRKPQARELVVIAVLCAIAVVARAAFFMVPSFKPMAAIVIIAAVCFGGEAGFFVGAISMFLSNMLMGQGPWTPWQMFCMGLIGFLAGVLFQKGFLPRKVLPLCIYAMISVPVIYGGLMNPASVLIYQSDPTWEMFAAAYALGFPFDLIHGASAVIFLVFLAKPMMEKLDRIKLKYGLL